MNEGKESFPVEPPILGLYFGLTLTPVSVLGGKNSMETKGLLPASFCLIRSMIFGLESLLLMVWNTELDCRYLSYSRSVFIIL